AIKEVASIVSASYLNVLSEMTGFSLVVSTPDYDTGGTDILNRVLSTKDIDMKRLDEFLCIRTEFIEAAAKIDAFLLFMPYDKSIQKILGSLGV
ncbi:MAG: hypothetical protein HQ558_04755, partial [Candidatus Omnitrophica bacterium]|nr:hypothetical protein [Candidatus Omnitrophota bacterium]